MTNQVCSCCKKPLDKKKMKFRGHQEDADGNLKWEMWNCECKSTQLIPMDYEIIQPIEKEKAA